MSLLKRLADNSDKASLANRLRRKRFALFRELMQQVDRPCRILDVGGTREFWDAMDFADEPGVSIVLLNLDSQQLVDRPNLRTEFTCEIGDARDLSRFTDDSFDVVFSNSVIEHIALETDQLRMMSEIRRVGKRYFVQTPNYFFPIEPHFHVPGFQYLPVPLRVALLRKFDLGWTPRVEDPKLAEQIVRSVRLLSESQFRKLAPEAKLYRERFCGLTKSYIAYSGWRT